MAPPDSTQGANDYLIQSSDPKHPANLIPQLCRKFWNLGWVTGTGGGTSIRDEYVFFKKPLVLNGCLQFPVTSSTSPLLACRKS